MQNHFIRGIIDGDGRIAKKEGKRLLDIRIFSYSAEVLADLKDMINDNVDLKDHWSIHPNEGRIPALRINNYENQKKFIEWLYKDATVYMDRKYEHAVHLLPS